jgi:electron transfer flavoprotein beta subunit
VLVEIVVLVKGVPDFREGKVSFKEDNTLNRGATPTVLNPNDHLAIKAALEVKVKQGATVHLVSMGPPNYKSIMKEAMEIYGDHAYLLSDRMMGGADTLATARTLGAGIAKIGKPDLVIAGFKSADGETGQTGPQTAWFMDYPILTHVTGLEVDAAGRRVVATRRVYDEIEEVEAPLPCFIVTDPEFKINYRKATQRLQFQKLSEATKARAASMDSHFKQWALADLPVDPKLVGLKGSPTIVAKVEPIPAAPRERTAKVYDGSNEVELAEVADRILKAMEA